MALRRILNLATRMVFPPLCAVCHSTLVEGEGPMCIACLSALPRTDFHLVDPNSVHLRLASPHARVMRAASWFHYLRDNPYAALIHDAKYRSMPHIARESGRLYAREILGSGFFGGVDLLLPVPLHRSRLARRGYNQAREVALGIGEATGIPVGTNLVALHPHSTQTSRNAWERWVNVRSAFGVERPAELTGRHVMVVDDVTTSGATLLACVTAINRACHGRITTSVITLAATLK